ncbi:MAG TPA: VOC family protein [Patescibacteria group bacterium]|jgi:catechol 2,3-dioxygenase-like lactoylglutathione lyase family enzyme|nr:VOC family protein [Patescibacteria group bacterium]
MTRKRTGQPWMDAPDFARMLTGLSVNLLVKDIAASVPFFGEVLGLESLYSDPDFAAFRGPGGWHLMLHADHTLDHSPLETARLAAPGKRGTGAEIRIMGLDPDGVEARARAGGFAVNVPSTTFPHGWRECRLEDGNGYMYAVGVVA